MDQPVHRDNRRALRARRLRLEEHRASLPEGAALKQEPQLELWSEQELEWIEVPPEVYDDLAAIISRLNGTGALVLSWRVGYRGRFPFSSRQFLAERRKRKVEAESAP